MLIREECERLETALHKEIAQRSALGGYSPEAHTLEFLCRTMFEVIRHIRESLPPAKPEKKK